MLNTHTYYSFHYGTVSPKQLVELIKTLGYNVLALTDINFTSAHLDFVRLCQKEGIKPILGVDFRDGAQQKFIALAKTTMDFRKSTPTSLNCATQKLHHRTVLRSLNLHLSSIRSKMLLKNFVNLNMSAFDTRI